MARRITRTLNRTLLLSLFIGFVITVVRHSIFFANNRTSSRTTVAADAGHALLVEVTQMQTSTFDGTDGVLPAFDVTDLRGELTVVTAYFNLGQFQKGAPSNSIYTPEMYRRWMTVFEGLESPTVAFIDGEDDEMLRHFGELRARRLPRNLTKLVAVRRDQLWAFRLEPDIAKIFAKPGYPRHPPNTVVAAYSSAMHAKYELMQTAIRDNPFRTRYFCWLDVGLFRELLSNEDPPEVEDGRHFSLYLPPSFRGDSVAYTEVYDRNPRLSVDDIVRGNIVWVCGCFFVGQLEVVYRWTQEYKNGVEKTIVDGVTGIDQQVIYAMFNTMNPRTKIQTYRADGRYNPWFHLGYVAREAGLHRTHRRRTRLQH